MSQVFAIPRKNNPHFYMKYSQDNEHQHYYYLLADTKKLIAQIEKDDPHMIEHARQKYEGAYGDALWLATNSESNPHHIGVFAFHDHINREGRMNFWEKIKCRINDFLSEEHSYCSVRPALTMSLGWAGDLITIQALGLPYVPIAVHAGSKDDEQNSGHLKTLIGAQALDQPHPEPAPPGKKRAA